MFLQTVRLLSTRQLVAFTQSLQKHTTTLIQHLASSLSLLRSLHYHN
nr:MAG TPA: hypothetical protein [Caudoviricetes sp.]